VQEEADICTGHILLYGALIRSGLLFKGTSEEQTVVFNSTIEYGSKRSYLVVPSHTFLITLLNKVIIFYVFKFQLKEKTNFCVKVL
jgi:hypothetical protein